MASSETIELHAATRPFTISGWRACRLLLELRWARLRVRWFGGNDEGR